MCIKFRFENVFNTHFKNKHLIHENMKINKDQLISNNNHTSIFRSQYSTCACKFTSKVTTFVLVSYSGTNIALLDIGPGDIWGQR